MTSMTEFTKQKISFVLPLLGTLFAALHLFDRLLVARSSTSATT